MTKRLICLASAVGLLASGCASVSSDHYHGGDISDQALKIEGKATPQPSDEAVYYILAAELAGQRGQFEVALDNYLKASTLTQDPKVLQRATQIALYLKKTDQALDVASRWLKSEPNNQEARRLTAMLLLKAGRTDEAFEHLSILFSTPGVDIENTMIDLVKLMGAEGANKDDGANLLHRLSERFPRMAELHFAYALLAADRGEFPVALSETEKALAQHPDWSRARLLQAQIISKMGNSHKAKEVMLKAMQSDPNNLRLRLIYSQFLAKSGDARGAEIELERILAKDPRNEDALLGQAMNKLDAGQEEKARQLFERLVDSPNRRMQAYFYLGMIDARKGNFQDALQSFDKVTEGPAVFDAQVNSVTALYNLDQLPEARRRLAELRKQNPQEALRLYLLEGELLSKNKDYAVAFDLLSQALQEMPNQPELLYTRALVAEQIDRVDVMESDLRVVLEKNPDDPNALNALGFTLADRSQRLDEAKRYIARALELKPGDPAILDSYGWVYYRLGDYRMALEYLRRAFATLKDPEIGAHLGEVLWESGNRQDAEKVWKESMRKDPEHKNIKKVMERYPEAFRQ